MSDLAETADKHHAELVEKVRQSAENLGYSLEPWQLEHLAAVLKHAEAVGRGHLNPLLDQPMEEP